uniref:Kazal-like domain-containing protein n=1 Tax=Timema cristinae TaxID=61476 RepID=A0A7R9H7Q4_TIMCR|nr:unnamed protein product [Timema cristinae]
MDARQTPRCSYSALMLAMENLPCSCKMLALEVILVRSNSDNNEVQFISSTLVETVPPQCGIGMYGYTWNPPWMQRFANQRIFILAISVLGLIHGASSGYFLGTAYAVAARYQFSATAVDWLLVGSELTQGVLALVVSYWGGRGHRPAWISFCVAFQAATGFLVIIPHFTNMPTSNQTAIDDTNHLLCSASTVKIEVAATETDGLVFVLMFLIQMGIGVANTSILAHGVSFIDDNVNRRNSPILIGWPILSAILLITAVLISMFPHMLPSRAITVAAASILRNARGVTFVENNKSPYLQDLDGNTDLLKPPLVSLAVLISGLIISKVSPRPSRLAAWNVFVVLVVAILFVIYIFLDCDRIQNLSLGNREFLDLSHACNGPCNCLDSIPFSPVCAEDGSYTYFSPCHAGCRSVRQVDDIQIYMNCSCVSDISILTSTAKGGPCSNSVCTAYWSIVQAFGVISAALLGSCIVGNIILSFRCVLPQDKSTVIGLELAFVGLIAYIPGKIIYHLVAGHLLVAAVLDSFVCYFARNIPLYIEDGVHEMADDSENEVVNPSETSKRLKNRRATPVVRRKKKETEPTQTLDDNDSSSSEKNTESNSVLQDQDIRHTNFELGAIEQDKSALKENQPLIDSNRMCLSTSL